MALYIKRVERDLHFLRELHLECLPFIKVDENNLLVWNITIAPVEPPYNTGWFRIEVKFPPEYPLKPPLIKFKTKIYHPNISEDGQICLPIIIAENWNPSTMADLVIVAVVALVNDPNPEQALRLDVAEEFVKDRKKFMINAEEYTKRYAVKPRKKKPQS